MTIELNTLVALDGEVDRGLVETIVTRDERIRVIDYLELDGPASSSLGAGDALIVAVADLTGQVRDFVATARRQRPARPIVLLCPPNDDQLVSEAIAGGADDVVALPTQPSAGVDPTLARQLALALEKAVIRKRGAVETKDDNTQNVISVLGLKGGSGKTLTATNMAVALAQAGHSTAIMDLDLQFGDVALAMGLNPSRTMYDLVRAGGSLDADKLHDFLVEHPSGAKALLAPVRPDHASVITVPFLGEVQTLLAETFDFVVIDTSPSFSAEVISAVDSSTDVLMVVMRDMLSLKNTKLGLETLERMEFNPQRVKLLLNRANTNVGIELDDMLTVLGRDVDAFLPSNRDITLSINQGSPIVMNRGSEASHAFRGLAQTYIDAAMPAPSVPLLELSSRSTSKPPRRSLFRRPVRVS
jgi:pilus assembly protein CpaE